MTNNTMGDLDTHVTKQITDPDTGAVIGWLHTINRYNGMLYDMPSYTRFQGTGDTAAEAWAAAELKRKQDEQRPRFDAGGEWQA